MTISPFRYAGGKNRLLPILQEYLNPLLKNVDCYYEPFIGGGSVGLYVAQNYPNIKLFFNDKDSWVSSFWSVVSHLDTSKIEKLLNLVDNKPTIELFNKLSNSPPQTEIEKAYYLIFFNRTCFSGIVKRDPFDCVKSSPIGGKNQNSKYTVDCRYNTSKIKEKILYCHKLLSGRTVVTNLDIHSCLLYNKKEDVIYLDPPYFYKAHMLYNEYMSPDEHTTLSKLLKEKDNWVLSYDDCSEIRNLYSDNKIIDLAARYSINGKKNAWENKNELIILSK